MKVVILAGGLGTRLAEETEVRPKPMVEIGGRPLLWHIMKHYAHYGFREFVIALGYKGDLIKRYFLEYHLMSARMTVELATGAVTSSDANAENWTVHLLDTGMQTQTGGRLKRLEPLLNGERFCLTYGDGVSNVDLAALIRWHEQHGTTATITAVRPPARYGDIAFDGPLVGSFAEKPQMGEGWINGGFMVFEPSIFDYLRDDRAVLEIDGLERLASKRLLTAYRHPSFWQCMDTLREKRFLESLWESGSPPWRVWT